MFPFGVDNSPEHSFKLTFSIVNMQAMNILVITMAAAFVR